MHPTVSAAWPDFVTAFEGRTDFLYLDVKSLVTTGVGFLMDDGTGQPPTACLRLPWTEGGQLASQVQIAASWARVKARTDLAPRGGYAFRDVTTLRLSEQTITGLLTAKTLEFWSVLSATLPGLEGWPADAQLALLDSGWHMGPRFLGPRWPNFTKAAHAEDFAGMAEHCQTANRTRRDARHVRLYRNAAAVVELGIDPAILWDDRTPIQEDDEMALSEADKNWIHSQLVIQSAADREWLSGELAVLLPKIWASPEVDLIPSPDPVEENLQPRTVLGRILKAVTQP